MKKTQTPFCAERKPSYVHPSQRPIGMSLEAGLCTSGGEATTEDYEEDDVWNS